jgi:XTP/dITP diphosphohydrolase
MMRMRIAGATNNSHKLRELQSIFGNIVRIVSPEELGIEYYHEETGNSYIENAIGKADTLFQKIRTAGVKDTWVLSDDSGLSVPFLGGAPGIYSARFGAHGEEENLSSAERNNYLLDKIKDAEDRSAFYVCCMVLKADIYRFYALQETWHGKIAHAPKGTGGFGYDPIFLLPEGVRAAELSDKEKNIRSHRAQAALGIKLIINNLNKERNE